MVPHPFRNRVLQLLVSAMFCLLTKKHGAVTSSPGDQLTGNSLAQPIPQGAFLGRSSSSNLKGTYAPHPAAYILCTFLPLFLQLVCLYSSFVLTLTRTYRPIAKMSWSEEKLATSRTSIDGNRIVVNTSDVDMPDTDHKQEAAEQIAAMSPEEFQALEKKLLWKIDLKLIPWMTYVKLSSYELCWTDHDP